MTIDYLIVGQGLAGSLLAWELMRRDCSVIIIDNGQENASQVAAGLINPVTGMRFVKSAGVDTLLPAAKQTYSTLSAIFRQAFYIEKPMLRIFRSGKELTHCLKRLDNPDYRDYLGAIMPPDTSINNLTMPFGCLQQQQTGYLLTRPLLACLRDFFIARQCYRPAALDYRDIQLQPELRWQDISPRRIIFCEGYHATQNPWFSWLPFQPVKGEILTLEHHGGLPDKILNFGDWLIPLNSRHIRVGATFDRDNLDSVPTERGKNALLGALKSLSPPLAQATLITHQAHVRPCTLDKQPFIGPHPRHPQLAIFNGFGAKGSLQIPLHGRYFADFLLNNASLPSPIQRHYATHFPT